MLKKKDIFLIYLCVGGGVSSMWVPGIEFVISLGNKLLNLLSHFAGPVLSLEQSLSTWKNQHLSAQATLEPQH